MNYSISKVSAECSKETDELDSSADLSDFN